MSAPRSHDDTQQRSVEGALLYAAYERKLLNVAMTVGVALVGVVLFWPFFPPRMMAVWFAVLIVSQALGAVEWVVFKRTAPGPLGIARWQRIFAAQSALAGAAWALGPTLMIRKSGGAESALFVGVLLCVCAVAMISVAEQRGAMQAFIAAALLPPCIALWHTGGDLERLTVLPLGGGMLLLILVGRNFNQVMRTLLEAQARTQTILDTAQDAIIEMDADGRVTNWNLRAETIFGRTKAEALGLTLQTILPPAHLLTLQHGLAEFRATGQASIVNRRIELGALRKDGRELPIELAITAIGAGETCHFTAFVVDISERKQAQELLLSKRAEEEKAKLAGQLNQARKMESVGRLAGGVAHDFNNMLQVILLYVEEAVDEVEPSQPLHQHLLEIREAATRSADLTRQLLAFASQQVIERQVVNLNESLAGILRLLRRLLGESIDLAWRPEAELWSVQMDPTQLDQIVTNLCVNARDAIGDVGTITIETANQVISDEYCATHGDATPGEYVRLTVRDSGRGIDPAELPHIFEPFFTTKGVGQGTGLGLATVYGAVKQNLGFISVASELGKGTSFEIYLRRHVSVPKSLAPAQASTARSGSETILLVEDEPALLRLAVRILESRGYAVLAAGSPAEAIRIMRQHAERIRLLLTDVIMPEMNGRDLADALLPLQPSLKVMFMSGFTADVIAKHGVLDEGVSFIQKPFTAQDLTAQVRAVLDASYQ